MRSRYYQREAIDAIQREWRTHKSTLAVLATGLGKTIIMSKLCARVFPKRVLIIVHRRELAEQAQDKLHRAVGIRSEIEMGDDAVMVNQHYLDGGLPQVVVASVQTLTSSTRGKFRMQKFNPLDFGYVFCDESQHATSNSWRGVIDYFTENNPDIRVLGVTATPDRADKKALGAVFGSVACNYDIEWAVEDGWLVYPQQRIVTVTDIDLTNVGTVAGDLNLGDLSAVMETEKALHGVANATMELAGERKTLVFTASVEQARRLSEIFNRYKAGSSDWVCGETPKDARTRIVQRYRDGRFQFMCNCGCFTEGFDDWAVEVIAVARPTKSRALYTQICGRGLRPQDGLVDLYETAEDRKQAILESIKPHATILDFEGNSGRHKLVCTADILGGKYSEPVIRLARKKMTERTMDATQALKEAAAEQEKRDAVKRAHDMMAAMKRAKVKAKSKYVLSKVDPFDTLNIQRTETANHDEGRRLSDKQVAILKRNGIDPKKYGFHDSCALISEIVRRLRGGLATYQQSVLLRKFGYDTECKRTEAKAILDERFGRRRE